MRRTADRDQAVRCKGFGSLIVFGLVGASLMIGTGSVFAAPLFSPLDPPRGMTVERVVMLFRHGVRAPIDGEASLDADRPWPQWSTQPERLTPHDHAAMRRLGRFDRALFVREGLLDPQHCPMAQDLSIWTNIAERTIESGQGLAEGLAPDCAISVGHNPLDQSDPLFDPTASAPFDAATALASIQADTGGVDHLVATHRADFKVLAAILGCPKRAAACAICGQPSSLSPSADGRGLSLDGPIRPAAGTAQVLLLEYAEGLRLDRVGWGRATPARIAQIARLHALQLEIFYRAPYMARRWAWAMGPKIAGLLDDPNQKIALLVGHDDNVVALTRVLGVHIRLPGYGADDPPPGSALGFEVLRDQASGRRFVRLFYQSQSLQQLRRLTPLGVARPPLVVTLHPKCAGGPEGLCPLSTVQSMLRPT